MRFWDASALVPLLVEETASAACRAVYREDPYVVVWWGTELECVSAVGRRERAEDLDSRAAHVALERLDRLQTTWNEIQPRMVVRREARRLLRLHPLRTPDATQLAAAIVASDRQPETLPFVCLDQRLADAARREGFAVVAPVTP